MKITRLAGLLATGALLATTAACGGGSGGGSPEAAAEKALRAVVDEDLRAMCEVTLLEGEPRTDEQLDTCVTDAEKVDEESKKLLEDADEDTLKEYEEQTDEMKEAFKKALDDGPSEVGDEEDGQVVVTYQLDGVDSPITTKKVDDDWYVDAAIS